jgi:hypothetical protein
MKNWDIFYKSMARHAWVAKNNPNNIQGRGEPEEIFAKQLVTHFTDAHLYTVHDDVHELLIRTEGTKDIPHMPFNTMFIDVDFDVEHFHEMQFGFEIKRIYGLLVSGMDEFVSVDHASGKTYRTEGKAIRIYALCLDDGYVDMKTGRVQGYAFNTFNVVQADWRNVMKLGSDPNVKVDCLTPKIRHFVVNYVSNLMNLLINRDREVVICDREYSEAKNKQRERCGELRVPKIHLVTPIGKLREYISLYKSNVHFTYGHSFEVSGHWYHYSHPRFKEKVGTRKWIYPFWKGTGIPISKVRDITQDGVEYGE